MVEFDGDIAPSITIAIRIRRNIAFRNEVCFRETMRLASISITQQAILSCIIARIRLNNKRFNR